MKKTVAKFIALGCTAVMCSMSVFAIAGNIPYDANGNPIFATKSMPSSDSTVGGSSIPIMGQQPLATSPVRPTIDTSTLAKLTPRTLIIVDKNDKPVSNANVNVSMTDGVAMDSLVSRTTNADGCTTLTSLYATPYTIQVDVLTGYKDNLPEYTSTTFSYTPQKIASKIYGTQKNITLKLDNYDVVASVKADDMVKTEYIVKDKDGKPVSNVWIKRAVSAGNGMTIEPLIGYPNGLFGGLGYTDKDGKLVVYSRPINNIDNKEYEIAIMLYQRDYNVEGEENKTEMFVVKTTDDNKNHTFEVTTTLNVSK